MSLPINSHIAFSVRISISNLISFGFRVTIYCRAAVNCLIAGNGLIFVYRLAAIYVRITFDSLVAADCAAAIDCRIFSYMDSICSSAAGNSLAAFDSRGAIHCLILVNRLRPFDVRITADCTAAIDCRIFGYMNCIRSSAAGNSLAAFDSRGAIHCLILVNRLRPFDVRITADCTAAIDCRIFGYMNCIRSSAAGNSLAAFDSRGAIHCLILVNRLRPFDVRITADCTAAIDCRIFGYMNCIRSSAAGNSLAAFDSRGAIHCLILINRFRAFNMRIAADCIIAFRFRITIGCRRAGSMLIPVDRLITLNVFD